MTEVRGFMRAIRESALPATDRHILLTLVSLVDPETGVIPADDMPSLTELAAFAGLGRSTVARRLNEIESAGWVKRERPSVQAAWSDKERTEYRLTAPVPLSTGPAVGLVPEGDQSTSPTAGPVTDSKRAGTSPAAGHVFKTPSSSSLSSTSLSSLSIPTSPTEGTTRRGTRLPADFHATPEMIAWARKETPNVGAKETEAFIDYFRSAPGQKGSKVDWVAAWRGWMRREQKRINERLQWRDNGRGAGTQRAASSSPIPPDEQCPKHRGQRKDKCGACRSDRLRGQSPPPAAADQTHDSRSSE